MNSLIAEADRRTKDIAAGKGLSPTTINSRFRMAAIREQVLAEHRSCIASIRKFHCAKPSVLKS